MTSACRSSCTRAWTSCVKEAPETVARYFTVVELGDKEVGLVRKNGKIAGVLAPGTRQLYWRGPVEVDVEVLDIRERSRSRRRSRPCSRAQRQPLAAQVADAVTRGGSAGHRGRPPDRGRQARRRCSSRVCTRSGSTTACSDDRARGSSCAGDGGCGSGNPDSRQGEPAREPHCALAGAGCGEGARALTNFVEFVNKELQFALREAIGARVLDELLGDKGALDPRGRQRRAREGGRAWSGVLARWV